MSRSVARELADALNELMLPGARARLCAPAIEVAPELEPQSYFVLSTLARHGPMPSTRLAERIGIDRSGVTRYAERLQRAGLLVREEDPGDRRSSLLVLTAEGTRLGEAMSAALADYLGQLTAGWPAAEARALRDGIERLVLASGGEPAPSD